MENNNPPNQITDEGRKTLLIEYQACQSHNNALGQQSWVSISILITVNLLLLGQVFSGIILQNNTGCEIVKHLSVVFIGLAMWFILWIFYRWDKRVEFQVWLHNERMRQIEEELGFEIRKNWRVRGLDMFYEKEESKQKKKKWEELNIKLQAMIKGLSKSYPQKETKDKEFELKYKSPTTKGFPKFNCVFLTLVILWSIAVLMEFLI